MHVIACMPAAFVHDVEAMQAMQGDLLTLLPLQSSMS